MLAYDGWQQDMEKKGFEVLSKAEKPAPVVDTPEQAEQEDNGPVSLRKVGDFYEMYGKNAEVGAEVLGLRMLSKNGSPMVGFPDHVKDEYSAKLREAGYTVLIEQAFELNPPKREDEKPRHYSRSLTSSSALTASLRKLRAAHGNWLSLSVIRSVNCFTAANLSAVSITVAIKWRSSRTVSCPHS